MIRPAAAPARAIPPKGTKAREVLDYLYANVSGNSGHGEDTIRKAMGNISSYALQNITSAGRRNGWIIVRGRNGFALSTTAKTAIAQELLASRQVQEVFGMKPMDPQYHINPLGTREGSNDLRECKSRHTI